jgi:hypothetical protein
VPPPKGTTAREHALEPVSKTQLGAMLNVWKWHPDLDILRVELVAMIEIVSASPLNYWHRSGAGCDSNTVHSSPTQAS